MDMPDLLPTSLLYVQVATSDEELFSLLREIPVDFLAFFEAACDDETWSGRHETFMRQALGWFTEQVCHQGLSKAVASRVATAVKMHSHVLSPYAPKNIQVKLKDGTVSCNGLLVIAASDYLKQLMAAKTFWETSPPTLSLSAVSLQTFTMIKQFVESGHIPELLVMGEVEITNLLKLTSHLEIHDLSHLCEKMLAKYLTVDNAVQMFIQGRQEHWFRFQQRTADFIEQHRFGFRLNVISLDRLGFEFRDFSDETVAYFSQFLPMVTDLSCHGRLVEDPAFGNILKRSSKLIGLDLSRSSMMCRDLFKTSRGLQEIDLSECNWVSQETLKELHQLFPNLVKISLSGDYHLDYLSWGELEKFRGLKCLDLSGCQQIQDDDLSIIVRGCGQLTELSLNHCERIGEAGFFALAKGMPYLLQLELAFCSITNTALVEIASRCRFLTSLNITSCQELTEKGIVAFVKTCSSLREINASRCQLSTAAIDLIKTKVVYL